jgi:hypothetical protein
MIAQPLEVLARVRKPVDVIHAHTVEQPVAHQLEHLPVRQLEDVRVLDAHAGQVVDGEEAPVPARVGVDIEDLRALPLVGPERVALVGGHVVRDDVEHDARRLLAERAQLFLAAQVGRDVGRVDHVVAVRRARPCLQRRREVEVRDPELPQVRYEPPRAGEVEVGPELEPVERAEGRHQPRRRTSSERASTLTGSRAANERSSAWGSAVESSSFQRAPNRRAGSWNVTGS